MEWTLVFTVIGVNVALMAVVITVVVWAVNKLDADIKTICTRLDGHAARIDQLYKMFVDLLSKRE
jgi:hypothetical protein